MTVDTGTIISSITKLVPVVRRNDCAITQGNDFTNKNSAALDLALLTLSSKIFKVTTEE